MFSMIVRCGKRLNCWKTKPTSALTFFRLATLVFSLISIPSISILPALWGWSRFNVLMNVDFPDPEGPRITMISPLLTSTSIPFRAQKSPKLTFTPFVLMMMSFSSLMPYPLLPLSQVQGYVRRSWICGKGRMRKPRIQLLRSRAVLGNSRGRIDQYWAYPWPI